MKPVQENGQAWADLTSTTSPSTFITVVSPAQTARNEGTSVPHPKGNAGLNYYNSLLDVLPCDLYSSSKMQQAQLVFNLAKFSTLHCSFASCTGYLWQVTNVLQRVQVHPPSRTWSSHTSLVHPLPIIDCLLSTMVKGLHFNGWMNLLHMKTISQMNVIWSIDQKNPLNDKC